MKCPSFHCHFLTALIVLIARCIFIYSCVNAQLHSKNEVFGTEVTDLKCFSTELAMVTLPSSVHPSIFPKSLS